MTKKIKFYNRYGDIKKGIVLERGGVFTVIKDEDGRVIAVRNTSIKRKKGKRR